MDLFQEARWFFEENDRITWYNEVVRKRLVFPRTPRFGILSTTCAAPCAELVRLRTNATYAVEQGYDASYAAPLSLFSDLGNMEMNDPCRQCVEAAFEPTMLGLTRYVKGVFGVLAAEMGRLLADEVITDPSEEQEILLRAADYRELAINTTRTDAQEYYMYYTLRGMYARFGAPTYSSVTYPTLLSIPDLLPGCQALGLDCPSPTVDVLTATQQFLDHVDGEFSSINTAGVPFPFWSTGNGTGDLFGGSIPFSGSGVDMSGNDTLLGVYLDPLNYMTPAWNPGYIDGASGYPDPITPDAGWETNVEGTPIYNWFMSSREEAASGTSKWNERNRHGPINSFILRS